MTIQIPPPESLYYNMLVVHADAIRDDDEFRPVHERYWGLMHDQNWLSAEIKRAEEQLEYLRAEAAEASGVDTGAADMQGIEVAVLKKLDVESVESTEAQQLGELYVRELQKEHRATTQAIRIFAPKYETARARFIGRLSSDTHGPMQELEGQIDEAMTELATMLETLHQMRIDHCRLLAQDSPDMQKRMEELLDAIRMYKL